MFTSRQRRIKLKTKDRQKSDAAAELIKERLNVIIACVIWVLLVIAVVVVIGLLCSQLNDHLSDKTTIHDYPQIEKVVN